MPPSYKYSAPDGDTKFFPEGKTSSRSKQFSDIVKQKLQSPRTNNIQKSQEKQKPKTPHFDEHYPVRIKSLKNPGNNRKINEKDELVKHMSNLPGYLQKVEKRENFQDKALNFGVLDWNLLEKWKYSDSGNTNVSSSGSSLDRHKRQPESQFSRAFPTKDKDFSQNGFLKEFENSTRNAFQEPKNSHKTNMPSSRNASGVKSERGVRREIDRIVVSQKGTLSSGFGKNEVLNSGKNAINARKKHSPNEQKNLVLILPKHSPKLNRQNIIHNSEPIFSVDNGKSKEAKKETLFPEVSSGNVNFKPLLSSNSFIHKSIDTHTPKSNPLKGNELKTPIFQKNEVNTPRSSDYASPSHGFFGKISRSLSFKDNSDFLGPSTTDEVHSSGEIYPLSLHSCPLSTGSKTKDKPNTRLHSLSVNKTPKKESSEDLIRPTEFNSVKSRFSSPNRRYGFSLSKMKKSLSFKEGLNITELGPERSEVSDNAVNLNENEDSLHAKSRSSPLRRLLDPILKPKECSPPLKRNLNLIFENENLKNTQPKESIIQALLQVTTKNGLPLFKLVVNNSSDILVAMKNIIPSGKQDFDSIYTFYSVHEIKRKSGGWINQVNKEKSYGFGYNVVGQMKGFSRFCTESSADKFKIRFTEKEFVLFNVDRKQGDGEAPELVPIRELASIIVRVPHERNIGKKFSGNEFSEYLGGEKYLFRKGENEKFHNMTVILSGGDHGLPESGAPSSLIQRWRSGGSCDCGGWDVGCKLHILTNGGDLFEPSVSNLNWESFNLFDQGGARDSKPIFRLAPFKKGIYSVEFSASISLLQSLTTCIAAISSQQSFNLLEMNFFSDGKLVEEPTFFSNSQELPGKYIASPPPSPVGRV